MPTETTRKGKRKIKGIRPQLLDLPANVFQIKKHTTAAINIYNHLIRSDTIWGLFIILLWDLIYVFSNVNSLFL